VGLSLQMGKSVKIVSVNANESVLVELTLDELALVTNSVLNAAEFISDRQFFTVMGFSKTEAGAFSDEAYAEKLRVGLRTPPPEEWLTGS
jgi:hypothetical protein